MIHPIFLTLFALGSLCPVMVSADEQTSWFVDNDLVFERGHALSLAYLKDKTPHAVDLRQKVIPWVVRIEAQHSFVKGDFTSNHGTGVILKNGTVVTAKHVLTKHVPPNNKKLKILLTNHRGHVISASVQSTGRSDWAILKINRPKHPSQVLPQSPVVTQSPVKGETVLFLGYPARLGLGPTQKVKAFHKKNAKKNIFTSRLGPMLVVAKVSDPEAMYLKPLAGFPPVGGMSGGPILNLKGELVGIQHSVTKTTDNATGKILFYRIDATSCQKIPTLRTR